MTTDDEHLKPSVVWGVALAAMLDLGGRIYYLDRERTIIIRLHVPPGPLQDDLKQKLGGHWRGNRLELRSKDEVYRTLVLWNKGSTVSHQPLLRAAVAFMAERKKWRPWGDKNPAPPILNETERLLKLELKGGTKPRRRET